MNNEKKIIPLHMHPAGLIESFLYFGATMDAILQGTGIAELALIRTDVKITYQQQCQLIRNGIRACGLVGLGLRVGERQGWCYSGTVGNVIDCSRSLGEAKAAFRRYAIVAQPQLEEVFCQVDSFVDQNNFLVSLLPSIENRGQAPEVARFEFEFFVAMMTRLFDSCGNKRGGMNPVVIGLRFPEPVYGDLYRQLPCASVNFNCSQSYIAAPRNYVTDQWRPLRIHCFERLMRQCEAELEEAGFATSHAEKVRWYVSTHFHAAQSIEEVARAFNLSARALSRRLALEETSFRHIFHSVKMELVCLHTRFSSLHIDAIAELTGFSSPSSLRRSVKAFRDTACNSGVK